MRKCYRKSRLGILGQAPVQWRVLTLPREEVSKGAEYAREDRGRQQWLRTGPALMEPLGDFALLGLCHFILPLPYEVWTMYFFSSEEKTKAQLRIRKFPQRHTVKKCQSQDLIPKVCTFIH